MIEAGIDRPDFLVKGDETRLSRRSAFRWMAGEGVLNAESVADRLQTVRAELQRVLFHRCIVFAAPARLHQATWVVRVGSLQNVTQFVRSRACGCSARFSYFVAHGLSEMGSSPIGSSISAPG